MKIYFLIIFVLSCLYCNGQSPENNTQLNYVHVPFQWAVTNNASHYVLTIFDANKKKIHQEKCLTNVALIKDKFNWGNEYKWQVTSFNKTKEISKTQLFQFKINENKLLFNSKVQFNILSADKKLHNNDLLFIENIGALIDRSGKIVWYLNKDESITLDEKSYRSMQMSPEGNITFLTNSGCYEVNLDGKILWQAPNRSVFHSEGYEQYHHHFAKTHLGTYMCASYDYQQMPHPKDTTKMVNVRFNTLIEYDQLGNYLWSWNEKDHVDKKVLFAGSTGEEADWAGTHMNGFVQDVKNNAIFISCRNSSQVFAINYLTGKILYTWSGKPGKFNQPKFAFYDQHGPAITANGDLLIYNNNIRNDAKKIYYPTIQLVENPFNKKGNLIWEYECTWNKKPEGIQTKEGFVSELSNGNFLVCIGGTERIFEVNKQGKIVWDCSFEKSMSDDVKKMTAFSNYRAYSASTLHPVFFGIQSQTIKNQHQITISNLGNNDSYTIVVKTADGVSEIKRIKVPTIANGKNKTISLPNLINGYNKFLIEIISDKNIAIKQELKLG